MVAFIDEQRSTHGVEPICKQLPIPPRRPPTVPFPDIGKVT